MPGGGRPKQCNKQDHHLAFAFQWEPYTSANISSSTSALIRNVSSVSYRPKAKRTKLLFRTVRKIHSASTNSLKSISLLRSLSKTVEAPIRKLCSLSFYVRIKFVDLNGLCIFYINFFEQLVKSVNGSLIHFQTLRAHIVGVLPMALF